MTDADAELPLLFLDVDGPLLPFGGDSPSDPFDEGYDVYLGRKLNRATGKRLAALPCRLVWATAWEQDANIEIGPRFGLPQLPVVAWPETGLAHALEDGWLGLHWKTRALVDWADGRAFAWIDDELTEADRRWVAEAHAAPALLHHVESSRGLAEADFEAIEAWLGELR